MSVLVITDDLHTKLIAHTERDRPQETCGLLVGSQIGAEIHLSRIWSTPNICPRSKERAFTVPPEALLDASRYARERGLDVLGCYHSHPSGPALPSVGDLNWSAADWLHLIVGCSGAADTCEVRCWCQQTNQRCFKVTIERR